MDQTLPCAMGTNWLHLAIVTLQMVQTVVVAYLANRARRKNREDRNGVSGRFQ